MVRNWVSWFLDAIASPCSIPLSMSKSVRESVSKSLVVSDLPYLSLLGVSGELSRGCPGGVFGGIWRVSEGVWEYLGLSGRCLGNI